MKRRLAWVTDPHFDHVREDGVLEAFAEELRATGADALVMTGDLAEAPTFARYVSGIAEGTGLDVYYVLGNHDFYRGSLAEACEAARATPHWLDASAPIDLGGRACLLGAGGWYDFRAGRGPATRVVMNDWLLIRDLCGQPMRGVVEASRALAEASATLIAQKLCAARDAGYLRALVATHVPPFAVAARHEGALSDPDWAPIMVNQAMGDALLAFCRAHEDFKLEVLCGHSHDAWEGEIASNLRVRVGRATYGRLYVTTAE